MSRSLGLLFILALGVAQADTVRLNDGTSLQGTIVSESDTEVVVEMAIAGGTILRTESVAKTNVAAIVRTTPEQRAEEAMQLAFARAQKYRLDPNRAFSVDYYDRVVTGVFQQFLSQHPDSPHQQELVAEVERWQAERQRVAAGQGKYRGEWLPAAEAERRLLQERDAAVLQQAQMLLSQRAYEKAAESLAPLTGPAHGSNIVTQADQLRAEIFRSWHAAMELRRQQLLRDFELAKQMVAQRQELQTRAEIQNRTSQRRPTFGQTKRLGQSPQNVQAIAKLDRARRDVAEAQEQVNQLQTELTKLDQKMAEVHGLAGAAAQAAAAAVAPPTEISSATTAKAGNQPAPVPGTEVVDQIGQFLKDYWWVGLGVVVLIVWGTGRLFSR